MVYTRPPRLLCRQPRESAAMSLFTHCNCILVTARSRDQILLALDAAHNRGTRRKLTRRSAAAEKARHASVLLSRSRCRAGWLGSRVVSMLDSGAEGPEFKSQPPRCRVTVLGKLFTPIMPLFTKQQNWQQPY